MGILMTIILLSFGENLEIEAYMLWPGLVLLGVHLREVAADIIADGILDRQVGLAPEVSASELLNQEYHSHLVPAGQFATAKPQQNAYV